MACWLPLWPSAHSGGGTLGNLDQTDSPQLQTLQPQSPYLGRKALLMWPLLTSPASFPVTLCFGHRLQLHQPSCSPWDGQAPACAGAPAAAAPPPGVSLTQVCLQLSHRPGQASPTAEPAGPLCFSAPHPALLFTVLALSRCLAFSLIGSLPTAVLACVLLLCSLLCLYLLDKPLADRRCSLNVCGMNA